MGAGRPQIELSDLQEGWKDTILELSLEGASIIELAVELEISRDTFYELSKRDDEFSDTFRYVSDTFLLVSDVFLTLFFLLKMLLNMFK